MKNLTIIFLLLSSLCYGQIQVLPTVTSSRQSGSGGGIVASDIDSVSVDGLYPASTKTPTIILSHTGQETAMSFKAWYQGSEVDATFSVTLTNIETSVDYGPYTGQNFSESLAEGAYHIKELTATNNNTKEINFIAAIWVDKPPFTEGEATITFDLAAIRNSTWTNPNPSLVTVTQGTNAVFDFNGADNSDIKIALKNNFTGNRTTWEALEASDWAHRARFQNVGGQVVFTSTGSANCMLFTEGNHYISIAGTGVDGVDYGIKFVGRTTAGTQSQLVYFIGNFIRGLELIALDFDGNRGQGATDGGPSLQWGTTTGSGEASSGCNWDNWDGDYFRVIGCRFNESHDEDIYAGHTSNAIDGSGFRPYGTGDVWVLSCTFNEAGRNHIQWSGTTSTLIANNYGNDSGLSGIDGQNQALSQNDGNRGDNFIIRNYFENFDMFLVITNGFEGNGNYYYIGNVGIQRTVLEGPAVNQIVFYNVENESPCHAVFANNTFKCPTVVIAPVCIQYDDVSAPYTNTDLTFGFYNNVISTGVANGATWDELRTVNTGSHDRTGWVVSNTFRLTAQQSQLKLNNIWRPHDTTAPLFNAGISLSGLGLPLDGDIDGQTFNVNGGYSEGAFGGEKLFTP